MRRMIVNVIAHFARLSIDEDLFEATKLNLFLHGKNLFEVTKFRNVQLISKRKYSQPVNRIVNEVINLRKTNERDKPRINHEIIKILQSDQSIELQEIDFLSWRRKIALVVYNLTNIDLSSFTDCKENVDRIIIHFSGPNNIKIQAISDVIDKINSYFMTSLTPAIGVSINPKLSEELVSIFIFYKN